MSKQIMLGLSDEAEHCIARLCAAYNIADEADVLSFAVQVLNWATDRLAVDNEVGHYADGDFTPVILPYTLDVAAWSKGLQ